MRLSRLSRAARIGIRYVTSSKRSRENRLLFDSIESYCMFIGYPRSGHTLVGALLDAHPRAVIGFERAALMHVHAGYDRDRLFQMLHDSSESGGAARWISGEYRYHVPGQWQGRYDRLQVIGDKQAEGATLRIRARPWLLGRLQDLLENLRNSYDYTILDSPPIAAASDSLLLSKVVDGVILVLKNEDTPREVVKDVLEQISGSFVIGIFMNGVEPAGNYYGYY